MLAKASSNKEKKMEEGQNKQIVITVKKLFLCEFIRDHSYGNHKKMSKKLTFISFPLIRVCKK